MLALGVDGCTGGWIGVRRLNDVEQLQTLRRDTLQEFLVLKPAPVIVAVDVPIGLLAAGARLCDKEVRRLLGLRRASVFPAPVRPMLGSRSHSEASAIRNSIEGKGMSIQAFGILEKITEVDELLSGQRRPLRVVRSPDAGVLPGKRRRPIALGWLVSKHIKPLSLKHRISELHWHALRHLNNSLMLKEAIWITAPKAKGAPNRAATSKMRARRKG